MLLKTYHGPDLAAALDKAREELGPEARVLATTEKPARFGLSLVEVTVAAPRETRQDAGRPDPTVPQLAREIRRLRSLVGRTANEAGSTTEPPRTTPPKSADSPALRTTVDALVASGLSPDLARRFTRIASGNQGGRADSRSLAQAATLSLRELLSFSPLPLDGRCVFIVGPPGSGKTTTAAKLVARAVRDERPVVFASADHDRIGAFEQASIFTRHLGSGLARIDNGQDLRSAVEGVGPDGLVVVDTPGIGSRSGERLAEVLGLRRQVGDARVAVLVPAGTHHAEAARVLDRVATLKPTCVGFSRVDDGAVPGELVTALAPRRLPLAFFTTGERVPHDLESASPHGLAALLLRAGRAAGARPEVTE